MRNETVSPTSDLLVEVLQRIQSDLTEVLADVTADELRFRPEGQGTRSVGWRGTSPGSPTSRSPRSSGAEPVWTAEGWVARFGLPVDPFDTGYGHSFEEVDAATCADRQLLVGYARATFQACRELLDRLDDEEWEQVIDCSYRPPVTVRVRVVSVIGDCWQHIGQAPYAVGLARAQPGDP